MRVYEKFDQLEFIFCLPYIMSRPMRLLSRCLCTRRTIANNMTNNSNDNIKHQQYEFNDNFNEKIHYYSRKKQTPVSLQSLLDASRGETLNTAQSMLPPSKEQADKICISIANFLRRELPIRLAHRVIELENLPFYKLSKSIQYVCSWYKASFTHIQSLPTVIDDTEKEQLFAQILDSLYDRHSSTLIYMARGAYEVRSQMKSMNSFTESRDIQSRLDDFYQSRIGLRVLSGQYLQLRKTLYDDKLWNPNTLGLVSMKCNVRDIAMDASRDASYMCSRSFGDAPEVTFHGRTDLSFPYVPSHLSYMLLELLKNSMRATAEAHPAERLPPIRIVIADGEDNEDVSDIAI